MATGSRATWVVTLDHMRSGAKLALVALVSVGCGGSSRDTETITVQDENGDSYEIVVTTSDAEACFELDGGALGGWCGDPVDDVTAVEVIGSAGRGVQPDGESGVRFEYVVVGVAPLETNSVRVSLGDTTQVVAATAGDRHTVWVAVFDKTVRSDGPLEALPQPSISAAPAG